MHKTKSSHVKPGFRFVCSQMTTRQSPKIIIQYQQKAEHAPKRNITQVSRPTSSLSKSLNEIHKKLCQKDSGKIFAQPVTEDIAPEYFNIIEHPMDLSTIRSKILHEEYRSLKEFREDVILMIRNCMTYNPSTTIFYQEATKLLQFFLKEMKILKQNLLGESQKVLESKARSYQSSKRANIEIKGVNFSYVIEQEKEPVPSQFPNASQQSFYCYLPNLPPNLKPIGGPQKLTVIQNYLDHAPTLRQALNKLLDKFSPAIVEKALRKLVNEEKPIDIPNSLFDSIISSSSQMNSLTDIEVVAVGEAAVPKSYLKNISIGNINYSNCITIHQQENKNATLTRLMLFAENTLHYWFDKDFIQAKKKIKETIRMLIAEEALKVQPVAIFGPRCQNIFPHIVKSAPKKDFQNFYKPII